MLSASRVYGPPAYEPALAGPEETPASTPYRGFIVATHLLPGESFYSFSLFDGRSSGRVASLFARGGFETRDEALAAGKAAVDLTQYQGVDGLGGFSLKSITKIFDKAGKGIAKNGGTIGAVVGGIVGSVVPGAGTAAGAAIGAAAGGALQAGRESKEAKKSASADKAEAEKQAKKAEKAAAADIAAAAADAAAGERLPAPVKPKIWPWLAGGGAALVVSGVVFWLVMRRKNS